jgi:hypothetical protein
MPMPLEELVWQVVLAAKAGNRREVRALAGRLLRQLRAGEPLMPDASLEAALALRDVGACDLLEELGQVLRRSAVMNATGRR